MEQDDKLWIPLGRIWGVPIRVHFLTIFSLFGVFGLFGLLLGFLGDHFYLVIAAAILGFLLLHEMAHAFMAKALGREVEGIDLFLVLGMTRTFGMENPWHRLWVSLAGPAINLILMGIFFALEPSQISTILFDPFFDMQSLSLLEHFAFINWTLFYFSLLPFPFSDGRHALNAVGSLLGWASWFETEVAYTISIAVFALGVLFQNPVYMIAGVCLIVLINVYDRPLTEDDTEDDVKE